MLCRNNAARLKLEMLKIKKKNEESEGAFLLQGAFLIQTRIRDSMDSKRKINNNRVN